MKPIVTHLNLPNQYFTKFRLLVAISIFFSFVFLASCVTMNAGFDFPDDQVKNIQIKSTTKEEIRRTFGEPWRVGLENGQETWTYGKYTYSGSTETAAKDLVVRFTDKDIVESYTFSKTNR